MLLYSLLDYLTNAISFSAFSYFTQGGYPIAAIITLFLSVLLLGKYSQIPFSCEDIDHFPQSLIASPKESVEEGVSTIQQGRNTIIGFFKPESEEVMLPPELLPPQTTIPKSEIELFFERSQNYFRTQIVDLQGSVTKNSCEFVMEKLKNLQMNDGFQLAVVLLLFFLFIGVAKILLRIISAIGFVIFLCLKPFKLYSLKKVHVERETLS
ncbi:MAG: hypothetical protein PHT72_01875 [Candidatus Absconditabacteria bacterium]|nr:hypothetical protein [Candidatus Absconditabacteria bacterium]